MRRRLAILGLSLLWLATIRVPPVAAHAVPESSSPAPNAVLETAPEALSITFNEPVVPALSQIRLLTHAGEALDIGAAQPADADHITLTASLPALASGTYLVSWQVLSAVDGHTTSGTYSFGVGVAALAATAEESTVVVQRSNLSAVARWLTLTAVALLIGLFAFRLLVWNPIFGELELEPADEQLDLRHAAAALRWGAAALGLLGLGLGLTFSDQATAYRLFQPGNLPTWLATRFGSMWVARLLLGLATAVLLIRLAAGVRQAGRLRLRGLGWWAGLLAAVGLGLTVSLISHSAALLEGTLLATVVDLAHTLAAGVWAGGLVYLATGLWQARRLPAESRSWLSLSLILNFSSLAALAVGILLASGSYLAWRHVGSWIALVGTAYGRALLLKLGLALVAMALAGVNLLYLRPRLDAAVDAPDSAAAAAARRRFRRVAGAEAVVALTVLLAAGFLADFQRGVDAPLLADAPGRTVVTQPAEGLTVQMAIEPALVGQNTFDIFITDEAGRPVADADQVSVRFTFLGQSVGAASADAAPRGDGHYLLEGSYISLIGPWQTEVAVRRPNAYDTFAPFRLEAGLGGNIRSLAGGGRPLERWANFMTLAGGLATGVALVLFAIGWGFVANRAAQNEGQLLGLIAVSLLAFWFGATQLLGFFTNEFTPTKFLTNPILPDTESVAAGATLFQENCIPCHGPEGRGDGPLASSLSAPPADFGAGHTDTHPDGDLYYWIREGIDGTAMPAFGEGLTREETWHLVNYVRRLSAESAQQQANQATPAGN